MIIPNELYEKIDNALEKLDYQSIDIAFKPTKYAFYVDGNMCYKDEREPFFSSYNNPNAYQELTIIEPDFENEDILIAYIVTMMYKKFLLKSYPQFIPNYIKLSKYHFNYLAENYIIYEETLLRKAFRCKDINTKRALMRVFLNTRSLRYSMAYKESFEEEEKKETYHSLLISCFFNCLKQINKETYRKTLRFFEITNYKLDDSNYLKFFYSFASSFYLKENLEALNMKWNKKETLSAFAFKKIKYMPEIITLPKNNNILNRIKNYGDYLTELFSEYYMPDPIKVGYKGVIHSFNPYGILRLDTQIYFKDFVVLKKENGELDFIPGPIVVKIREEDEEVIAYYRQR